MSIGLVDLPVPDAPPPAPAGLTACPTGPLIVPSQPPAGGGPVRLSLIIPTYNERKNIAELIGQLSALLDPVLGSDYELLVIDDDSPDRTWELAAEIAARSPARPEARCHDVRSARLLRQPRRQLPAERRPR